jgi:hypothetical protein
LLVDVLTRSGRTSCSGTLSCVDVKQMFGLVVVSLLVLVLAGPLAARVLRLPRPSWFALPPVWGVALFCVDFGPDPSGSIARGLLMVVTYGLLAAAAAQRPD